MCEGAAVTIRASYTHWPGQAFTHKGTHKSPWQTGVLFVCPHPHVPHTLNSTHICTVHTHSTYWSQVPQWHTYHTPIHSTYVTTSTRTLCTRIHNCTYYTDHILHYTNIHTAHTPHGSCTSILRSPVYAHLITHHVTGHTHHAHSTHSTCTMYTLHTSNYTHTPTTYTQPNNDTRTYHIHTKPHIHAAHSTHQSCAPHLSL